MTTNKLVHLMLNRRKQGSKMRDGTQNKESVWCLRGNRRVIKVKTSTSRKDDFEFAAIKEIVKA